MIEHRIISFTLDNLSPNEKYYVQYGMPAYVEVYDDGCIAYLLEVCSVHGEGSQPEEAVQDLKTSIVEYYEMLKKEIASLGSHPMTHLTYFNKRIVDGEAMRKEVEEGIAMRHKGYEAQT